MKETTLFARYKDLINYKWAQGHPTYTSYQLNANVGQYEKPTHWKRVSNNHYYTTRTYQTALKELGCITMIKRGLWQINGPIPQWFGSFHINGLKGQLDHNCEYWNSLPAGYKINPWKAPIQADNQPLDLNNPTERAQYINNTHKTNNNMKVTNNAAFYTVEGLQVCKEIPILTATYQVNIWQESVGIGWGGEVMEATYYYNNREIADHTAEEMITAYVDDLASFDYTNIRKHNECTAIEVAIQAQVHTEQVSTTVQPTNDAPCENTYTKAQVERILKEYTDYLTQEATNAVEGACHELDEENCVEIELCFNRSLDVNLNTDEIAENVNNAISASLSSSLNAWLFDFPRDIDFDKE